MFKTGDIFIDQFSVVVVFIPLLPVIIIFLRSIYQKDVLLMLMILCLLNFIGSLLIWLPKDSKIGPLSVQHIFSLLEILVFLQIFRPVLLGRTKDLLDIFRVAYISSMFTYYAIQGLDRVNTPIDSLQEAVIIMLALAALFNLVKTNQLYIFYLPLFWMAVGTLFYFTIVLLMDVAGMSYVQRPRAAIADKIIVLNVAGLVRYFFYALAALLYHPSRTADRTALY